MQIEYSKNFIKEFKKCPNNIKVAFKKRIEIFINNKYHQLLNNHCLVGEFKDYRSINVNGGWHAIFQEINLGKIIYFVTIGTHSKLYS